MLALGASSTFSGSEPGFREFGLMGLRFRILELFGVAASGSKPRKPKAKVEPTVKTEPEDTSTG